jgi:hypothetical protein
MKNFLLPVAVSLVALSSQLEADIAAPCEANTLAFYDAEGFSCTLGEGSGGVLDFSGFSFSAAANAGSPTLLTDSQIEVTPDPVGQGGGFTFTAPGGPGFTVGAGQTATYDIDYSFLIEVDPFVSGANIGMDPVTGNVGINEQVCADDYTNFNAYCPTFGVSSLDPSTPCTLPNLSGTCWQNSIPLDVVSTASLENSIVLTGSSGAGAGFDALTDTYVVTPEPATFVLLLGELVAIGLVRRYRSIR